MPDMQMAQSAVAAGIKEKLKDPDTALFKYGPLQRGIVYKPPLIKWDGIFMCGAVNARNSYGGYGGFHPFFAYIIGDGAVVEMDDLDSFTATDYCRSIVPVN